MHKRHGRERRHLHIRHKVKGTAERPRVLVFRSNRHIYAQVIDDDQGKVLVGLSSLSAAFKEAGVSGDKKAQASAVGKLLAEELKKRGVTKIVFDRAGYRYHGRVKALAEVTRQEGLEF